jgi:ankyrin repeat protein
LLRIAVGYDHPEIVKLLLDKGAEVDAKGAEVDGKGADSWTALNWAVRQDKTEIPRLLLDKGANIESRDDNGWTPLMYAASAGKPENVKLLLARGADASAKATSGSTALQIILPFGDGNAEVLKLLRAERLKLAVLLKEDQFEDETLTDELVDSKNKYLPGFIDTATAEQRVALLSDVEKRLVQAQRRILELNSSAEDAIRQGQNAAGFRTSTGKVQAYMSVLKVIQKMLSQPPVGGS